MSGPGFAVLSGDKLFMNLLLLSPGEITDGGNTLLTGRRANHLRCILHVEPGQVLRVGIINGPLGEGRVLQVDEKSVKMSCSFNGQPPPVPRVDLLLALPRPLVLKRLWAQIAAIGVGRIILTNANRVERHYFGSHTLKEEYYRALIIEGLEQARATRVPDVTIHRKLKPLIEQELDEWTTNSRRLMAHPEADKRVHDLQINPPGKRILLAIGPEGGWTDCEVDLFSANGFETVTLGPRVLRTDTACVALLTMMHEDLARPRDE